MSPIERSPLPTGTVNTGADAFIERPGREIYEEKTISGLNRLPIATLISFIIGGTKFEKPPFDIEDLAEHLLVDGTVIIYNKEFLGNIVYADELKVVQKLEGTTAGGKSIHRVFRRENKDSDKWTFQDFEDYGLDTQKALQPEPEELPEDSFHIYINGEGILFPNQKQLWRIDQIFQTMQKQTTGAGVVKKLLTGYLGGIDQLQRQMESGCSIVGMPGGPDTRVHDIVTSTITDQLIQQLDKLVPYYFQNLHIVDTEGASTVSGISRKLLMTPMTTFIEKVRGWIVEVCGFYNYPPVFERLPMESIEEREKELNLLERLLEKQVITPADFTAKARELIA